LGIRGRLGVEIEREMNMEKARKKNDGDDVR
jgi:hypothetical protein